MSQRDWSRAEVEAAVADYLDMLYLERAGRPYSKTEHRRRLGKLLNQRSDGSIERKHQNISAALIALGLPYVDGYKPLQNYQQLLYRVVEEQVRHRPELVQMVLLEVESPPEVPQVDDILRALVDPPEANRKRQPYPKRGREVPVPRPAVNYLEMEARNARLGLAGEEFVVRFEIARLVAAGEERLASRVVHVAATRGDGEGYDILSFEQSGAERLIEVKTTAYGNLTPFFVTKNEVEVSSREADRYHLYRLFRFRKDPHLFQKRGSLREQFVLEPSQYRAAVA